MLTSHLSFASAVSMHADAQKTKGGKLIFIGGVSGAGKTTFANSLCSRYQLPIIHLDSLYKPLESLCLSGLIGKDFTFELGRHICSLLLPNLIAGKTGCVVEGAWIEVVQAARWKDNPDFHPAFCGIPNAIPAQQLEVLKRRGHWIGDLEDGEALRLLEEHIAYSAIFEDECARHAVPFFDFSDFESGSRAMMRHFNETGAVWLPADD